MDRGIPADRLFNTLNNFLQFVFVFLGGVGRTMGILLNRHFNNFNTLNNFSTIKSFHKLIFGGKQLVFSTQLAGFY